MTPSGPIYEDLIEYIDVKVDEAFIKSTIENASFNTSASAKENLKIVFTSLHGTSIKLVPDVLAKADEQWSIGALTLPHMLVRLIVAEQVYRAASLLANHPYHRA